MGMKPIENPAVEAVFEAYPPNLKKKLLILRQLIFDTASEIEGVGELKETLKWGEPSYLTAASGSGTTIRIDRKKDSETLYAMYVHCQTNLVETFRSRFHGQLQFEGNRSVVFSTDRDLPVEVVRMCIAMALTYHRDKPSKAHSKSRVTQSHPQRD